MQPKLMTAIKQPTKCQLTHQTICTMQIPLVSTMLRYCGAGSNARSVTVGAACYGDYIDTPR